jgi:hypothetical protein
MDVLAPASEIVHPPAGAVSRGEIEDGVVLRGDRGDLAPPAPDLRLDLSNLSPLGEVKTMPTPNPVRILDPSKWSFQ